MQHKIKVYLKNENRWKDFIKEEKQFKKTAILVNITVPTMQREGNEVRFDISFVYRLENGQQKQVYESGIADIDGDGVIYKTRKG